MGKYLKEKIENQEELKKENYSINFSLLHGFLLLYLWQWQKFSHLQGQDIGQSPNY